MKLCIRIPSFYWLVLLVILGFSAPGKESEYVFKKGELLQFKLSYGWLAFGRGSFEIHERFEEYLEQSCFRVTARGSSTGLVRWLAPVKDEWGALIRERDLRPLYTFRNINEGRYQLNEEVFINPENGNLIVESVKPHRKVKRRPTRNYKFDETSQVHDLLSGLMKIRNFDFDKVQTGDTLELKAFFEDRFYDFQIVFAGEEELKTKFGRLKALKLIPLMPENGVFDGQHALEAWFSADGNRLPLKISARMFIGKVSAELISYQNIKYSLGSE